MTIGVAETFKGMQVQTKVEAVDNQTALPEQVLVKLGESLFDELDAILGMLL